MAHPWAAFCAEPHPRVQLYWLVETAELVVRWTVAVALAEVLDHHHDTLPIAVTDAIAEHIERPTLGRWLGILRALGTVAPASPVVTDGVFDWVAATLPASFRAEGQGATLNDSLLVLRNQLAHGGGLSRDKAQALIAAHLPTLIALLSATRNVLGTTVVEADGHVLRGTAPDKMAPPVPGDGVWLVRDGMALPLEPLVHHGPVTQVG